jgi:protein TonB
MLTARTLVFSVLLHTAVISLAALSPHIGRVNPPGEEVMLVELRAGLEKGQAEKPSGALEKPPPEGVKRASPPEDVKEVRTDEKQGGIDGGVREGAETAGIEKKYGPASPEEDQAEGEVEGASAGNPEEPQAPLAGEGAYTGLAEKSPPETHGPSGLSGSGGDGFQIEAVSSPPGIGGNEEDLVAEIREAIRRATSYPAPARERRIEGTVVAGFFINSTGMPEDIKVLISSGHTVLDKEVVRIIKRAAPYPPLGAAIEVPISFRLLKGE